MAKPGEKGLCHFPSVSFIEDVFSCWLCLGQTALIPLEEPGCALLAERGRTSNEPEFAP